MKWFKCPNPNNPIFLEAKQLGRFGNTACFYIIKALYGAEANGLKQLDLEQFKIYAGVYKDDAERLLPYANRLLEEMQGFSTRAKNAQVEATISKKEQTQVVSKKATTKKPKQNGSRLPDDWKPSNELLEWVNNKQQERKITLNIPDVIIHFCNYWHAKTGADATKKDWDKTFQNWILNQFNYSKKQPEKPQANAPKVYTQNVFKQIPIEELEAEAERDRILAKERRERDLANV